MIVKYLGENERFSDDVENEIIEIDTTGPVVWIEGIIKEISPVEAINTFFKYLAEEQNKHKNVRIMQLEISEIKKYAMGLCRKGKNSRRDTFRRFGYSWRMEELDNIIYVELKVDVWQSKYTLSLKEVL